MDDCLDWLDEVSIHLPNEFASAIENALRGSSIPPTRSPSKGPCSGTSTQARGRGVGARLTGKPTEIDPGRRTQNVVNHTWARRVPCKKKKLRVNRAGKRAAVIVGCEPDLVYSPQVDHSDSETKRGR